MRTKALIGVTAACLVWGCAVGGISTERPQHAGDGGILGVPDSGSKHPDAGGQPNTDSGDPLPVDDSGSGCSMTLCGNACVDTTSDNNNCGQCFNACPTNSLCMNGTCQSQATGTPPQGTCSHSLCDLNDSTALNDGCDPSGCVSSVCVADSFCCTDFWDSVCVSEVATYCSPYSCP